MAKRWKVGLKTCYTYPIGFLLSSDHSAAWHSFGRELGSGSPAICCCVTIAVNAPESAPQVACAATLGPAVFGELSLRRYSMAFILLWCTHLWIIWYIYNIYIYKWLYIFIYICIIMHILMINHNVCVRTKRNYEWQAWQNYAIPYVTSNWYLK